MIWVRYVTFADVPKRLAEGWEVVSMLNGNHGNFSVLMQWGGDHEPA